MSERVSGSELTEFFRRIRKAIVSGPLIDAKTSEEYDSIPGSTIVAMRISGERVGLMLADGRWLVPKEDGN